MVFFSKGIKPCGYGKIFSYSFFTVFFGVSVHIQDQPIYKVEDTIMRKVRMVFKVLWAEIRGDKDVYVIRINILTNV